MFYKFICNKCENITEELMTVAKMEVHKTEGVCEKCGEKGSQTVYFENCPGVFFMGDGWTNAWKHTSRRSSKGQQNLDAALRENDALEHASKHDPKFIRAGDVVKRLEDKNGG